jgi:hypothetical protein
MLLMRGHDTWSSGEVVGLSVAVVAAGLALAGLLLLVRVLVKRRSSERTPCPGCGSFLARGEECPVCPRGRRSEDERD